MDPKLMEEFNKLVVDHDYNPLKRMMKNISRQDIDIDISNEQLFHNVILECFEKKVANQQSAWENPMNNGCSASEIERPFYNKNIHTLPDPVENDHLSFIDSKYWIPANIKSREDRKTELKNKNVSITGWNYNERDISDLINCFNTIKKIRKENLILFMNFENVLEYTLKLASVINDKKCLSDDEKNKLKFNETIKEFTSMNHSVNKMVEQLEHLKDTKEVSIMTNSEFIIQKMMHEINFFRKKYKKNYVVETDYIHFEDYSQFLYADPVHKFQIGQQNAENYYYPAQPKEFQLKNVLQVKKMEDDYNIFTHLNDFIQKNLTTQKDDPTKSKKEILKDICSEYSEIFQTILENSHLKSKIEYIDHYKDSFLHINALTSITNLTKKNIREICDSKLNMKSLHDEISVNFEKVNKQINQYSALFETMQLKYPVGYIADLLISSFFNGLNYERSANQKFKDLPSDSVALNILKQLSKEKDLSIYTFNDGFTKTIISAKIDSFILNNKPTVQYNSVFFGFNQLYKNKDNLLNTVFYSQLEIINSKLLQSQSLPQDESKAYEACYDLLTQKPECQTDITTIFQKTKPLIESIKKGCLMDENLLIFYYINFFVLDTLLNCSNGGAYTSAFKLNIDTVPDQMQFNERKAKSLEYLSNLDVIQLYNSVENKQENDVLGDFLGFSVRLFNTIFYFDNQYFFVVMNSFFKCFIPLLLSEHNTCDLSKISNYECLFESPGPGFKQFINLTIEDKLCLKGIKINECNCTSAVQSFEMEFEMDDADDDSETDAAKNSLLTQLNDLRSKVNMAILFRRRPTKELVELLHEISYFDEMTEIALRLYNELDENQVQSKLKEFSDRFDVLRQIITPGEYADEGHGEGEGEDDEKSTNDADKKDIISQMNDIVEKINFSVLFRRRPSKELIELQIEINNFKEIADMAIEKNGTIDEKQVQSKLEEFFDRFKAVRHLTPGEFDDDADDNSHKQTLPNDDQSGEHDQSADQPQPSVQKQQKQPAEATTPSKTESTSLLQSWTPPLITPTELSQRPRKISRRKIIKVVSPLVGDNDQDEDDIYSNVSKKSKRNRGDDGDENKIATKKAIPLNINWT